MIVSKEQVEMVRKLTKAMEEYAAAREELGEAKGAQAARETIRMLFECIVDAYNALLRDDTEEAMFILGETIHMATPEEDEDGSEW